MILKIIILLVVLGLTNSLKSSEICLTFSQQCKENLFSSNRLKCQVPVCSGKFKHPCGINYCTESASTCKLFLNVLNDLNSAKFIRSKIIMSENFEKDFKLYDQFVRAIKPCTLDFNQTTDACLNLKKCSFVKKLPFRFNSIGVVSTGKCPCNLANYSYDCKNNYCAKNNIICKAVEKTSNIKMKKEIKNCRNDNSIVYL